MLQTKHTEPVAIVIDSLKYQFSTFSFFLQAAKLRSHVLAMKSDRKLTKALEINGK